MTTLGIHHRPFDGRYLVYLMLIIILLLGSISLLETLLLFKWRERRLPGLTAEFGHRCLTDTMAVTLSGKVVYSILYLATLSQTITLLKFKNV